MQCSSKWKGCHQTSFHTERSNQSEGSKNSLLLAHHQTPHGTWALVSRGWEQQFEQEARTLGTRETSRLTRNRDLTTGKEN